MKKFSFLVFGFCFLVLPLQAAVPDGYVVKIESPTIDVDWGKASGVQVGDSFSVYRQGEELKHPVTGEILGRVEKILGQGIIEQVQAKFSIGHLVEARGIIKPGDRTRYLETKSSGTAAVPAASVAAAGAEATATLRERWRSEPLPEAATVMTLGDIDGDGQKEIALAFPGKITVFRWSAGQLKELATFKGRGYRHWLAIEAADPDHQGRDDLFATAYLDGMNRSRVVVLRWENNALKSVANVDGFVRAVDRMGGARQLIWQDMSHSRELHFTSPAEFLSKGNEYKTGARIKLPRHYDDQVFGFTFGDWDGDGSEDMAILVNGDRLRVHFKDSTWTSSNAYGGTKNDFTSGDQQGSFLPRLLTWQPPGAKPQLIVPLNLPEMGIRFTYLKLYKKAEITAFNWNGLEMAPVWTLPVSGYLPDFSIGDAMHESTPQLWAATIAPGDKTVLLAYSLP